MGNCCGRRFGRERTHRAFPRGNDIDLAADQNPPPIRASERGSFCAHRNSSVTYDPRRSPFSLKPFAEAATTFAPAAGVSARSTPTPASPAAASGAATATLLRLPTNNELAPSHSITSSAVNTALAAR